MFIYDLTKFDYEISSSNILKLIEMEKEYQTPAVRVADLHLDFNFCVSTLSGGLEKTYDDLIDEEE